MNPPSLHQLHLFYVVAKRQSVSRAAEELYLHQSSVSLQIQRLEKAYGVNLLERVGRRVCLTEAGQVLYKTVEDIFERLGQTEKAIDELKTLRAGHLAVGATAGIGTYHLPLALQTFRGVHPGVDVEIFIASRQSVERYLLRNELELGFVSAPVESAELQMASYATDELVVIFSPAHPFASRDDIHAQDVAKEAFFAREVGSSTRATVDKLFSSLGLQLRTKAEIWGTETLKQAVAREEGISILSKTAVRFEVAAGILRAAPMKGLRLVTPLHVCHQRGKTLSKAALAFIEAARVSAPSSAALTSEGHQAGP